MSWLPRWNALQESDDNPIIYLSPEAMRHVYIMPVEEFEDFQNSPEFIPGGRLMEVCRQYSYTLRQVADLREEAVSLTDNWKSKTQAGNRMSSLEDEELPGEKYDQMAR